MMMLCGSDLSSYHLWIVQTHVFNIWKEETIVSEIRYDSLRINVKCLGCGLDYVGGLLVSWLEVR